MGSIRPQSTVRYRFRFLMMVTLIGPFGSSVMANEFDAAGVTTLGDLYAQILGGLDPSGYYTIVFKGPGMFDAWETIQGDAPPNSGRFGAGSLFQNMRFEGTSTSDTFLFRGGRSQGCNPCTPEGRIVSTYGLSIDNVTWTLAPNANTGDFVEDFIINNGGNINLNNGYLKLDQAFGSGHQLSFSGASVFNITGTDNKIIAPGGAIARSFHDTKMRLHTGSKLEISGTTDLDMRDHGYLQMDTGSELAIIGSKVVLTKQATASTAASVIDGGKVSISGLFGSDPSSLVLSNPTIKNSAITLGHNTRLASSTKSGGILQASDFNFEGNNTVTLAAGSALVGFSGVDNDQITAFNFKDGRTDIIGAGTSARLFAQAIRMDNAHLHHEDVDIQNDLILLSLTNGSTLSHKENNGESLEYLRSFKLTDSAIESDYRIGLSAITKSVLTNSTIKQSNSRRTRSTTFYLNGFEPDAANKATVTLAGNNVFESRIDPTGKDIGIGSPGDTPIGIKSYADSIYFTRWTDFTDDQSSVNGLANLTVELNPFASGLNADAYAAGGEMNDGVYDVMVFNQSNTATTDATADADTIAVRLGGNMPALLTATQVATPSADQQVSYKLEVQPVSSLLTNPVLTTQNQQAATAVLVNSNLVGNTQTQAALNAITNNQLQSQTDSFHAEPYSSNMTVALEQSETVMNSVLMNAPLKPFLGGRNNDFDETTTRWWFDTSYTEGDIKGESGLGNFEYSFMHLTVGADLFASTEELSSGVFFSYGDHAMDEHDRATQDFENDVYHIGVYRHHKLKDWSLSAVAGYAYGDHASKRSVQLASLSATPEADFSSDSIYLGVNAGFKWLTNDTVELTPQLGFSYLYYQQDGLSESGDPSLSLELDKADAQAIITSVGMQARFKAINERENLYPISFVRFEHDLYAHKHNDHDIKAGLKAHPCIFRSYLITHCDPK